MNIFEKSSRELASNTDAKAELAHPIKWVKALALLLVLIIPSTFTVNSYAALSQSQFDAEMRAINKAIQRNIAWRNICHIVAREGLPHPLCKGKVPSKYYPCKPNMTKKDCDKEFKYLREQLLKSKDHVWKQRPR